MDDDNLPGFPWLAVLGCLICAAVAVLLFIDLGCSASAPC